MKDLTQHETALYYILIAPNYTWVKSNYKPHDTFWTATPEETLACELAITKVNTEQIQYMCMQHAQPPKHWTTLVPISIYDGQNKAKFQNIFTET